MLIPSWAVAAVFENKGVAPKPHLHPKLDPSNYELDFDFGHARDWKAKILMGNNMRKGQKLKQWDRSRYVMISLVDDTIVPIAIADEHRVGFELLHKIGVPSINFYSFDSWGTNYIYHAEEVKDLYIVGRKFIKWGGNGDAIMVYGQNGIKVHTTLTHFLTAKGDIKKVTKLCEYEEKQLSTASERLLTAWRDCAKAAAADPMAKSSLGLFFNKAKTAIKEASNVNIIDYTVEEVALKMLDRYKDAGDFQGMTNFMFGYVETNGKEWKDVQKEAAEANPYYSSARPLPFNGVHNSIHNELRKLVVDGKKSVVNGSKWLLLGDVAHLEKEWSNM